MRPIWKLSVLSIGLAIGLSGLAQAQVLIVLRAGDGVTAPANTGAPIFFDEFTTTGAFLTSFPIPATGASGLQLNGTATSEGFLSLSPDGSTLAFAGYNPGAGGFTGTGALSGRTSAQAPRAYGTVNVATGNYSLGGIFTGTGTDYTAGNIRSAFVNGSTAYGTGSLQGVNAAPSTSIEATQGNVRVSSVRNNTLYYSSGSATGGVIGISSLGSPPPTGGPVAPVPVISGVTGEGTSPYAFQFSPGPLAAGSFAYVGDSNATTTAVQKFTFNGTAWSLAYNLTTAAAGVTDIAVDFSGTNPIIYAISPSAISSYVDTGVGGAMTTISGGLGNGAFRGLELVPGVVPVPEPGTMALIGFAAVGFAGRRIRRKKMVV